MTEYAVERTASAIRVGARPPHPERTALVEARGALLFWDVLDPRAHPAADVWDPVLAADWLWEVYGPDAADAILNGHGSVAADRTSPVLDAARDLAHLTWAAAWWPASHAAAVPALPEGILRAETAWRTAALEHLLDDEDAVERALTGVDLAAVAAYGSDPDIGRAMTELEATLTDLAESFGIELRSAARTARDDWALAAGGTTGDLVIASGGTPVDWSPVPQGLLDAAGESTWQLAQRAAEWVLTVSAPAAPGARPAELTAVLDTVEIPLRFDRGANAFTGEALAPPDVATRLARGLRMRIHAPGYPAATDPDQARLRADIIEFARRRLTAPDATLTETAAGLR
ncbi:hypothetical protein [Glycomyces albidus]|uniref:Uncharacterized protein n=1 Tax=Glycomyces albidus TaxID=2656774 RepID=A0A6L5GAR5_9ACTN|nr:hypothetical protein [Glycomyces albidus]MQM26708.1 hypothetical protein [Glycomyces albidus]